MPPFNVQPIKIKIPQKEVDHYLKVLRLARLPEAPIVPGAEEDSSYGTTLADMKDVKKTFLNLKWRKLEAEMNKWDHFTVEIEATKIHFVHQRSSRPDAIPLLILHGWPFTIFEYKYLIEPLTNPPPGQPAFHVVLPSLPGIFLSSIVPDKAHSTPDVARTMNTLMVDVLGYKIYGAHGGDFGAINLRQTQLNHPDTCRLIHFIGFPAPRPADFKDEDFATLDDADKRAFARQMIFHDKHFGYFQMQSTERRKAEDFHRPTEATTSGGTPERRSSVAPPMRKLCPLTSDVSPCDDQTLVHLSRKAVLDIAHQEPDGERPKRARKQKKKCPRGSNGKVWKPVDSGGYGTHSAQTRSVLGKVINLSDNYRPQDSTNWAHTVASYLHTGGVDMSSAAMLQDGSIPSLLWQLQKAKSHQTAESFLNMLNLIILSLKTESVRMQLSESDACSLPIKRKRQDASINEVFLHLSKQQKLAVKNSTFHEWVYKGRKFASLAAAGSMYLLWMIAASQAASTVGYLVEQEISDLCDMILAPKDDTSLGKSIGGTLIPLLTQIRERHPIILRYIFPTELLEPGESRDLDFTDLVATQRILDYLKLHQIAAPPRDETYWHAFLTKPIPTKNPGDLYAANARSLGLDCVVPPLPAWRDAQSATLNSIATTASSSCIVVLSGYKHDKTYRKGNSNPHSRKTITQTERRLAQKAEKIENLAHLERRLRDFYTDSGQKTQANKYLYVPYQTVQPE
ncbi:hypothetical protein ONZ45_g2119 [Pleurotus djamor]|nr:hypothetical protein ONZ45_g2119 [Pleurotus djamor]